MNLIFLRTQRLSTCSIVSQIQIIFCRYNLDLNKSTSKLGFITDIRDGDMYKRFRETDSYTLSINTDGVSPFQFSKRTIWPIYLVLNELPVKIRYKLENVIVAGES